MPRIVANILCHNDLVYLENLIPQVERYVDKIIVVDDCSIDGTKEFLERRPMVHRIERKFDLNFSNQRNAALEEVDNGEWAFRIDSDELPTTNFKEIPHIVEYFESRNVNRFAMTIYHLVNTAMCKVQTGVELRLFKKNASCLYIKPFHELIHGDFGKEIQVILPDWFSLIHFKYADKNKLAFTKGFFVDNGLYDPKDLQQRIDSENTFTPPHLTYEMSDKFREYICTNQS